ncbi:MAG: hypothetical protein HY925_08580 [Elusimicrobia bacterium]|nr:hypothetical protein [Elusimicrobiota bacterium]
MTERSRFFPIASAVIAVVVFAGFSATFYRRPQTLEPLSSLLVFHGVAFTLWILAFGVQTALISQNKVRLHMRLGWAAAALAVVMTILGYAASVDSLRKGRAPIPGLDPRAFFVVPFTDIANFWILALAGILKRKEPAAHKRLMYLATVATLDAAIARIPLKFITAGGPPAFFGLTDLFIFALWIWDKKTEGRIHPASRWAGWLIIVGQPVRLAISGTRPWLAFADLFL